MSYIRKAEQKDLGRVYELFRQTIEERLYFPYDEQTSRAAIESAWVNPKHLIGVAEKNGEVVGAYIVKPNQPGYGSHVANAAYMVDAAYRGQGLGRALALASLTAAREAGYRAMQYNLVVSTNTAAVALWEKIGFRIIGTVPGGFLHPDQGYVDAHIMHRHL